MQESIQRQMLQVSQVGVHVERLQVPLRRLRFEVDEEEPLSDNGGFDMASIELNVVEIG